MANLNWAQPVPLSHRRGDARRRSPLRLAASGLLATLIGVGLGVGAWAVVNGASPSTSAPTNVGAAAPAAVLPGPTAVLDQAKPGAQITPTDWVGAIRSRATSRAAVSGTMEIHIHPAGDDTRVVASQAITFGVDPSGLYAISYPGELAFGTADGIEVAVSDNRKLVMIQAGLLSVVSGKTPAVAANGELNLPNDAISRIVYPDRWIETMQTGNDVTVLFTGADKIDGRAVSRYRITFGKSTTKYSDLGWDFAIDSKTGVLVHYVIHYSDAAGGGSEEVQVTNFGEKAFAAPDAGTALPAGYRVQAAVGGAGAPALVDEVRAGDTVGALTARLKTAKPASNATG
jgi:hypothetical protein